MRLRLLLLSLLALLLAAPAPAVQIRVACVGDSITYGARLDDRAHHSYPARLQALLGPGHEVRNFGLTGRTLRAGADLPYLEEARYLEAIAWAPQIVLVQLGTNDVFLTRERPNWVEGHDFAPDLRALLAPFEQAAPGVRIIVVAPPDVDPDAPQVPVGGAPEIGRLRPRLAALRRQLREIVRTGGRHEFIDLFQLLQPGELGDGFHPTPFGADRIAARVATAVRSSFAPAASIVDAIEETNVMLVERGERFGFRAAELRVPGASTVPVRLLEPERALAGRPWVLERSAGMGGGLRAVELLERGFHVVEVSGASAGDLEVIVQGLGDRGLGEARLGASIPGDQLAPESAAAAARSALRAAGVDGSEARPTTTPIGAVEFRARAGWGAGRAWHEAATDLRRIARRADPVDVLFLGGTIVQGMTEHPDRFAREHGERPVDDFARGRRVACFGLAGERVEHLLYRVVRGDLDPLAPRVVVLQVGLANLRDAGHTPEEVERGLRAVTAALQDRFPGVAVLSSGPFPAGASPEDPLRASISALHARLAAEPLSGDAVHFDPSELFVDAEGRLIGGVLGDGRNITRAGQRTWLEAIAPLVDAASGY